MIAFAFLCALHEIGQGQTDTACQRAGNDKGFDRLGVAADEVAFQQVTHGLCEGHTRRSGMMLPMMMVPICAEGKRG